MSDRHEYDLLDAVNWSTLRALAQSPAHYRYRLEHPPLETPRMLLGRAVHAAILEPEEFAARYVAFDGPRRAGKAWEEFAAAHSHAEIMRADEYDTAVAMAAAVRLHPVATQYLAIGRSEVSLVWTDDATGVACKARPDWISNEGVLVEIKTVPSVEAHALSNLVARMLYHCQLAFYTRACIANGIDPAGVKLVAVEIEPPHDVAVYDVDDDVLYAGDEQISELLRLLVRCRETGEWPGRYSTEQRLHLPRWIYAEEEYDELALQGLVPAKEAR